MLGEGEGVGLVVMPVQVAELELDLDHGRLGRHGGDAYGDAYASGRRIVEAGR